MRETVQPIVAQWLASSVMTRSAPPPTSDEMTNVRRGGKVTARGLAAQGRGDGSLSS